MKKSPPVKAKVFITTDLSGSGLLAAYRALGVSVSGRVAVKLHMGEPGNTNYLRPHLVRDLCAAVDGTLADSNVYYGGPRSTTAGHLQVAREHGFTFAPVDILDADGDTRAPVSGGRHLREAIFGAHITRYDWIISVAHFKGHAMAGFGGTFKNLAIGVASPAGKGEIHRTNAQAGRWSCAGEPFFEKIIEYNRALADLMRGRLLYLNVLNNLSVDCDCDGHAAPPSMPDIGILSSTDPVALDQASLDQIYARPEPERRALVARIEGVNGAYQLACAEKFGLGRREYELQRL